MSVPPVLRRRVAVYEMAVDAMFPVSIGVSPAHVGRAEKLTGPVKAPPDFGIAASAVLLAVSAVLLAVSAAAFAVLMPAQTLSAEPAVQRASMIVPPSKGS